MSAEQTVIQPGSPQWAAWRADRVKVGDKHGVEFMDKAAAAGKSMRVRRAYPTEESRQQAEAAATEPRRASTDISEGARWLGLYGSMEEPLLDARGALTKAGVRPSDTLLAVTTREAELPSLDRPSPMIYFQPNQKRIRGNQNAAWRSTTWPSARCRFRSCLIAAMSGAVIGLP
jgi:hypothetical protein